MHINTFASITCHGVEGAVRFERLKQARVFATSQHCTHAHMYVPDTHAHTHTQTQTHARVQSGLIKRMKAISSNLDRELGRIASVQGAESSLPPCNLDHHMEQLIALYTKELQLKQTIVSDLGRSPEQQHQLVCLSAWLEQPYLAVDGQHHNDALAAFLDALQHCSRR